LRWPALALAILAQAGCGGEDPRYESQVKDRIALEEELVEALASVKDDASMKAAEKALADLNRRAAKVAARGQDLPPIPASTRERLERDYNQALQDLTNRKLEELRRIREQVPGGPDFLARLGKSEPPPSFPVGPR
jgi:hypothetical protein